MLVASGLSIAIAGVICDDPAIEHYLQSLQGCGSAMLVAARLDCREWRRRSRWRVKRRRRLLLTARPSDVSITWRKRLVCCSRAAQAQIVGHHDRDEQRFKLQDAILNCWVVGTWVL